MVSVECSPLRPCDPDKTHGSIKTPAASALGVAFTMELSYKCGQLLQLPQPRGQLGRINALTGSTEDTYDYAGAGGGLSAGGGFISGGIDPATVAVAATAAIATAAPRVGLSAFTAFSAASKPETRSASGPHGCSRGMNLPDL